MTRTVQGLGLTTTKSKNFTILHSQDSINRQIRVAKTKLSLMSPILRDSMEQYLTDLRYFICGCNMLCTEVFENIIFRLIIYTYPFQL